MANTTTYLFEHKTCPRCGGTGHYSYNPMYGTVCFKCHGKREVLTPRGLKAQNYYIDLLTFPADQIVPGDVVEVNDFFTGKKWGTVVEVDLEKKHVRTDVLTISWGGSYQEAGVWKESPMLKIRRRPRTDQEAQEVKDRALAYQSSLTYHGKPKK